MSESTPDGKNGRVRKYAPIIFGAIAFSMTVTPIYLFYAILSPLYVSKWCFIAIFLPLAFGFSAIGLGILNIRANFEAYNAKIGIFLGGISIILFVFWLLLSKGWYV